MRGWRLIACLLAAALTACGTTAPRPTAKAAPTQAAALRSVPAVAAEAPAPAHEPVAPQAAAGQELARGKASWYGPKHHGRRTASGERFDMNALTAAHRTLPFGTRVRVRNQLNGREVVVRINDRGPHTRGRIIDLSRAAAQEIGLIAQGEAPVLLLAP